MYFDYESPNVQGHNISQPQILQGAGYGQRLHTYFDPNGDFGGAIIKNKIWFYLSLRDQTVAFGVVGAPIQAPGTVPSYAYDRNATYKLTGNINQKQRLSHYIQWNPILKPQRNLAAGDYEDAMYYQKAMAWVGNVQWTSTWSPKFFTNMLIGTWGYNFPQVPYGAFAGDPGTSGCPCAQTLPKVAVGQLAPRMTDLASGDIAGAFSQVRLDPRRYQVEPTGSYFVDKFLGTTHQFRFGYLYEREIENDQYYAPVGGANETFNSKGLPDYSTPYQVTITNMPRIQVSQILHHGAYGTDQFKVGKRVTVNVGLRWDYYSSRISQRRNLRSDCQFMRLFLPRPGAAEWRDTARREHADQRRVPGQDRLYLPARYRAPRRRGLRHFRERQDDIEELRQYGQFYSYPSTQHRHRCEPCTVGHGDLHLEQSN